MYFSFLFTDILLHRSNLRTALQLSTNAQDNHLRALILSLIASQYVHTSPEHAATMLATAEQLGAGLGASGVKGEKVRSGSKGDGVGNAHLRLWIGEKSLGEHLFISKCRSVHFSNIDLNCFLDRTETKSW